MNQVFAVIKDLTFTAGLTGTGIFVLFLGMEFIDLISRTLR